MITIFSPTLQSYQNKYIHKKITLILFSFVFPILSFWLILNSSSRNCLMEIGTCCLLATLIIALFLGLDFMGNKILKINDHIAPVVYKETVIIQDIEHIEKWHCHTHTDKMLIMLKTKFGSYSLFLSHDKVRKLDLKPNMKVTLTGKILPGHWFTEKGQLIFDCELS